MKLTGGTIGVKYALLTGAVMVVLASSACSGGNDNDTPAATPTIASHVDPKTTLGSITTATLGLQVFTDNPLSLPNFLRNPDASAALLATSPQAAFLGLALSFASLVDVCQADATPDDDKTALENQIIPAFHALMFSAYPDQWPARLQNVRDTSGEDCLDGVPKL